MIPARRRIGHNLLGAVVLMFIAAVTMIETPLGQVTHDLDLLMFAYNTNPAYPGASWDLRGAGTDSAGNVYAAGNQWYCQDGACKPIPAATKWDASGRLLWKELYDLAGPDETFEISAAVVDPAGNIYMGGRRLPKDHRFLIIKLDPTGNVLWWKTRKLNDNGYWGDIGISSMQIDKDGNIVCVGYAGRTEVMVVKYRPDGVELGANCRPAGGLHTRYFHSCGTDLAGNIYVGHNTTGTSTETHNILDLCWDSEMIWIADNTTTGTGRCLYRYDPGTNVILKSIASPFPAELPITGVAWDEEALWVATATALCRIDPETGNVLVQLPREENSIRGLTWDGTHLWFGDFGTRSIKQLDITNNTVILSIQVAAEPIGVAALTAGDNRLFVSLGTQGIRLISVPSGLELAAYACFAPNQGGIAYQDDNLWVGDTTNSMLYQVDPWFGSGTVLRTYLPFPGTNPEDSRVAKWSTNMEFQGAMRLDLGVNEHVMALDCDSSGNMVATIAILDTPYIGFVRFTPNFELITRKTIQFAGPFVIPRAIAVGPGDRVFIVGRTGTGTGLWELKEDDHLFTLCLTIDGDELWREVFDPGGNEEKEWGRGTAVAAPTSNIVYSGGSLSYSETSWNGSFCVLVYTPIERSTESVFRIHRAGGHVLADGSFWAASFNAGAADLAEWVPVSEPVEPGDVLELDPTQPGKYRLARGPCSTLVAGVVATQPGFVLGHGKDTEGKALLALLGVVPVKVTDENGPIRVGDLLVASSTPGHAMRWDPERGCGEELIGKALEVHETGQGIILVLLMR